MTRDGNDEPTREYLQACSDRVKFWWHSIDLGQGVVTPGEKTPAVIARELKALRLPDLRGKSVLDIGAYDGYYSFASAWGRPGGGSSLRLAIDLRKAMA